ATAWRHVCLGALLATQKYTQLWISFVRKPTHARIAARFGEHPQRFSSEVIDVRVVEKFRAPSEGGSQVRARYVKKSTGAKHLMQPPQRLPRRPKVLDHVHQQNRIVRGNQR